jgi:hypothetical protein
MPRKKANACGEEQPERRNYAPILMMISRPRTAAKETTLVSISFSQEADLIGAYPTLRRDRGQGDCNVATQARGGQSQGGQIIFFSV